MSSPPAFPWSAVPTERAPQGALSSVLTRSACALALQMAVPLHQPLGCVHPAPTLSMSPARLPMCRGLRVRPASHTPAHRPPLRDVASPPWQRVGAPRLGDLLALGMWGSGAQLVCVLSQV